MAVKAGARLRAGRCGYDWFINQTLGYKKWLYAGDGHRWRYVYWTDGAKQQVIVRYEDLRAEAWQLRSLRAARIRLRRLSRRMQFFTRLKPVPGGSMEMCSVHHPAYQLYGREYQRVKSRLKDIRRALAEMGRGQYINC